MAWLHCRAIGEISRSQSSSKVTPKCPHRHPVPCAPVTRHRRRPMRCLSSSCRESSDLCLPFEFELGTDSVRERERERLCFSEKKEQQRLIWWLLTWKRKQWYATGWTLLFSSSSFSWQFSLRQGGGGGRSTDRENAFRLHRKEQHVFVNSFNNLLFEILSPQVWKKAAGVAAACAVGAVGAPIAVGALGFSAAGIVGGSWAAWMMSSAAVANGGGVVAMASGGIIAALQSAGAGGAAAGVLPVVAAAAGGAAGGAVAAVVG